MICLGQSRVKFMRKIIGKIVLFTTVLFGAAHVEAQDAAASGTNADSFGDIAALGQQISLAQRKIQAMELKDNLEKLEAQQTKGYFPYKVLRVEGFGETLYAILSDDAGILYQVGPGDLIANQYRITLLRPSSVGVVDVNSRKPFAVPFVVGGSNTGNPDDLTDEAPMPAATQAAAPSS